MEEAVPDLQRLAAEIRNEADRVVVVGAGGATLAPWVFAGAFAPVAGFPRLSVLDSTEPSAVAAAVAEIDPVRTIFVVSSRSGATLETNLLFDLLFEHAARDLGEAAGRRFLVVTESGSALATAAGKRQARTVFPADARTPADFAALSHFGLLPAALAGIDVGELLGRARRMAEACRAPGSANPGLLLGAALGAEALAGRDKLTLSFGPPVTRFGSWIEALVAAATGKDAKGIVPVDGEPIGTPEVYGSDRLFAQGDTAGSEETAAGHRLATLVEHGHPLAGFVLHDALDLGAEIFRWEFAAVVAARILEVNPFDEPDLGDARDRASRILAGGAPEPSVAAAEGPAAFEGLLAAIRPGDYLAITAFLPERPPISAALEALRLAVRKSKRVATTVGFGPRFQHVAGQLHKGGGDNGVFLQLTSEPATAVPIPGRPWGFEKVFAAQADGDLEALLALGRRAARVRLAPDLERGIADLTAAVGRERSA
jgi:transaldolase/glucose-6-phosphate isomerase